MVDPACLISPVDRIAACRRGAFIKAGKGIDDDALDQIHFARMERLI